MSTHVEKLSFRYNNQFLDPIWVILDSELSPPLLPLLFSTHLSIHGEVFEFRELVDSEYQSKTVSPLKREVSDSTIRSYIYCLSKFLTHLEKCKKQFQTPGMHQSSVVSQRFLNHYINEVLASSLDSYQSLNTHRSALAAYYNWLTYMEMCPKLTLSIYRKTRQSMASRSVKQHYIQYVSRYWRLALLNSCETLSEKLVIRMGFEVGLRTSELLGIRVSEDSGLVNLFSELKYKKYGQKDRFSYLLKGRYTKRGKSRWIYFDRDLLTDMKRYYETDREELLDHSPSDDSCFFLRTDQGFKGHDIGTEHASRVFRKRASAAGLNPLLTFHDLRHTFATELFHAELRDSAGQENRSESAALIVVAQRLGHSFGKNGQAPATTTRYIRMRIQMLEMESIYYEEN